MLEFLVCPVLVAIELHVLQHSVQEVVEVVPTEGQKAAMTTRMHGGLMGAGIATHKDRQGQEDKEQLSDVQP